MKNLRDIYESLLDDEDELSDSINIQDTVERWIEDNFNKRNTNTKRYLMFINNDDGLIVHSVGNLIADENTTAMTNGMFKWGRVGGCLSFNGYKGENLIGAPVKCGELQIIKCPNLKSLEGGPEVQDTAFISECMNLKSPAGLRKCGFLEFKKCGLKDLIGIPKDCDGISIESCEHLRNLSSLNVNPKTIRLLDLPIITLRDLKGEIETLKLSNCKQLKNLNGFKATVEGTFQIDDCPEFENIDGRMKSSRIGWLVVKNCPKFQMDLNANNSNIHNITLSDTPLMVDPYKKWSEKHSGNININYF